MKNPFKCIYISIFLLISTYQAIANGQIDDNSGWGIKLYLNVGYVSDQSQFNTDGNNAITPDLKSSGEKTKDSSVFPLVRLDYTLPNLKTQFFLGQAKENIVRGLFQAELGVAHMLGEKELLEVAYAPKNPSISKTWEDPYVSDFARNKTDQSAHGFRISWRNAMDSPFTLRYGYASSNIDDELSGQFLGLSQSQRSQLYREGDYHRLTGEYMAITNNKTQVIPVLSYTRGNTVGRAIGYDGYRIGLEAKHAYHKRHRASLFLDYEHRNYLETNPVFNERQKDDEFGITATYIYLKPFGWEHTSIFALATYDLLKSNISLYGTEGAGVSIGFGWKY